MPPRSSCQLVNETIQIGTNTNLALQEQGMQIEKINSELDEMQFSIKAAAKHLQEMTRSARPLVSVYHPSM